MRELKGGVNQFSLSVRDGYSSVTSVEFEFITQYGISVKTFTVDVIKYDCFTGIMFLEINLVDIVNGEYHTRVTSGTDLLWHGTFLINAYEYEKRPYGIVVGADVMATSVPFETEWLIGVSTAYGYIDGDIGDLTPNEMEGATINYLAGGMDFLKLRTVSGEMINNYEYIHIDIPGIIVSDLSWAAGEYVIWVDGLDAFLFSNVGETLNIVISEGSGGGEDEE